jgi:hypothetical protein
MLFRTLFVALAATLLTLWTASPAQAWGAYHVGYTHVGYGGVQHYGRTAVVGPYGAYGGAHYGGVGYGGAYRGGYGYGDRYGGAYGYHAGYGGYDYGGFRAGGVYGGYRAGVYRRW